MGSPVLEFVLDEPIRDKLLREVEGILGALQFAGRERLKHRNVRTVQCPCRVDFTFDLLHSLQQSVGGKHFALPRHLCVDRPEGGRELNEDLISRHCDDCARALRPSAKSRII
jgi:hypothetical protein